MTNLAVSCSDGVATVTINFPPVNAVTLAACRSVRQVFEELPGEQDARCIILTGAGIRAFCAGLDFADFVRNAETDATAKATAVREMYAAVHDCGLPVIAAVNGPALGAGCVLASVCDVRVASKTATFALPEINLGRIGGAAHLGRLLAPGTLRRLVLTGVPISASEAYRIGLVDEVAADGALEAAMWIAASIASKGALALKYAKRSLNEIEERTFEDGYRIEQALNAEFRETHDAQEAARAWVERRAPSFRGR